MEEKDLVPSNIELCKIILKSTKISDSSSMPNLNELSRILNSNLFAKLKLKREKANLLSIIKLK